jgi:putative rhamnosyltransferase
MRFRHFVITRFNIRINEAFKHVWGPVIRIPIDPLDPAWLSVRFKLFEMTCLPSIVGQLEQNFAWMILVDSHLQATDRERLLALTKGKKETFIHACDAQTDLTSLDWLRPYLGDGPDYVITTNLDNDDALPARFVATMHDRVRAADKLGTLPPIGFIGAKQIVQWDLLTSPEAPLGWKAAWHRQALLADDTRVATTASAGLSLLCGYPAFNFCVLGITHAAASAFFNFSVPPPNGNAAWFRRSVANACEARNIDLTTLRREDLYYDISKDLGAVLMTNHFWNGESQRILERKSGRTIVTGPADFPHLLIDWDKARLYADSFGARAAPVAEVPSMRQTKAQAQALMTAALPFAQDMLQRRGEFSPYGAVMRPNGDIVAIRANDGREHPPSGDVIKQLKEEFADAARKNEYKATALVYDVRVTLPSTGAKSDAIAIALDHRDNFSMVLFFPYVLERGLLTIGEAFSEQGASSIFRPK